MSLDHVLKALVCLGLSRRETEVYVYLATEGPQEAAIIAGTLKLKKQQELSSILKSLQDKKS